MASQEASASADPSPASAEGTHDALRESILRRINELEAQTNASGPDKLHLTDTCSVCTVDLLTREACAPQIAITQCGHGLCVPCINQLKTSAYPNCPLCRAIITKFWTITLQDPANQRALTQGGHPNFGYSAQAQDYNPSARANAGGGRVNGYQAPAHAFPSRVISFNGWAAQHAQPSQAADQLLVSANPMRYSPTRESLKVFTPSSAPREYVPLLTEGGAAPASNHITARFAYVNRPDGTYDCVVVLTHNGPRLPGSACNTDFIFINDVSGSMDSHYRTIVDIANEAIRNLHPEQGNRMAILVFATNVLYLSGGLSSSPREITSEYFGGSTQTEAALRAGIRVIHEARGIHPARRAVLLFFSDGAFDGYRVADCKAGHDAALCEAALTNNCDFKAYSLGGGIQSAAFVEPLSRIEKSDCYGHCLTPDDLRANIRALCGQPSPSAISVRITIGDSEQVFPQSVSPEDTLLLTTNSPLSPERVEANPIPRVYLTAPDGTEFEIAATLDPSVGEALKQRYAKDQLTAEINQIHAVLQVNPETKPAALAQLRQITQSLSRDVLGVYLEEIRTLAETTINAINNPSVSADNSRVASQNQCFSQRSRSFAPAAAVSIEAVPAMAAPVPEAFSAAAALDPTAASELNLDLDAANP